MAKQVRTVTPLPRRLVPIETVSADPANLRVHNTRGIAAIAASLRRFGQQKPIVIGHDGVLIAGNGTLEAAKLLGWTHVQVVKSGLEGAERIAYSIADNRTGDLSSFDDDALGKVAGALPEELREAAGFTADELAELAAADTMPPRPADDRYREQYAVMVLCRDEAHQKEIYEQLQAAGHECKVVTT